ncbi:DUF1549 domain-containing protein [Chondromyces crocatus]|uniref:DUF1549 domain-containing protein n=1 Tax=Chondromyces crocatus TaxID=52 RepID=A0A0K1EQT9_CHOCO|nr:DUF1549 domain-containing protein [Chondromyces crocatus]AKT43017.1 uncharacterized protein CMC5_072440 [Chondromyces crocatus]
MRTTPILLALATAVVAAACSGTSDELDPPDPGNPSGPGAVDSPDLSPTPTETEAEPEDFTVLGERQFEYSEALRTATLKLLRRLPTLEEIKTVQSGGKTAYENRLDEMMEEPRFAARMVKWWQDVMRQGGGGNDDRNTAPMFAAQLIVQERDFTELLTASADNCVRYDAGANTFDATTCNSGAPGEAGVLTNPGVMRQYYGPMAFRRVRWVQEIFACNAFPAEQGKAEPRGNGTYYAAWPWESISNTPVDFLNADAAICANCHQTINHLAPLFANFGENGMWNNNIAVKTNIDGELVDSQRSHWLPDTEKTAWRFGVEAADLPALGQAMAKDPAVHSCIVARSWNFVMSKEDIVSDGANVHADVIKPFLQEFTARKNLKEVLRQMFKSEDFTKF